MDPRTNSVTLTVAEYCDFYGRNQVRIDRKYQRNAGVWPDRARSYLIETMLRGFPIPKLALYQQTDVKSRQTVKYVVDGQQRTLAIVDFFNDELALSRSVDLVDARGRRFSGLAEDLQRDFLAYSLQFDQFEGVEEGIVREYFRRINSYTAPLNPEERRNANYQGDMKWLIVDLANQHSETLVLMETLTEKQVVRMGDKKLLAEIVHAMLNGVTTTSASALDKMHSTYDKNGIPNESGIRDSLDAAFNQLLGWDALHAAALPAKGYMCYSLILALVCVQSGWSILEDVVSPALGRTIHENAERNLIALADSIDNEDPRFASFVKASDEKTNTKANRATRIQWFAQALTEEGW